MKKELGLYVHIPFCVRKCAYCDFYSGPCDEEKGARYFDALFSEIGEAGERVGHSEYEATTIYIGGGTPSSVPAKRILETVESLKAAFSVADGVEISMEANPGTLTREKLQIYREAGINRLSLGLQSTEDRLLQKLGRIHDFRTFLDSYELARAAGFSNINIDLISGIPGQKTKDWENSLKIVSDLCPEHLSAYSLIIEEGTPFDALYGENGTLRSELPTEEEEREMYHLTGDLLRDRGYMRYEISNYAREGRACRHNLGTWSCLPYLGFGAAAASCFEGRRFKNAESLNYRQLPPEEDETLSEDEKMKEFMLLGLRKTAGVRDSAFQTLFHISLFQRFSMELSGLKENGLLQYEGDRVFLTERGLDLANQVFIRFV